MLAGYPEPVDEPTAFVRYAWSPRVFVLDLGSGSGYQLSPADWEGYGYPTPVVVDDDDAAFVQVVGDTAIYLDDDGLRFQLTYAEWAAAGYPTPEPVDA